MGRLGAGNQVASAAAGVVEPSGMPSAPPRVFLCDVSYPSPDEDTAEYLFTVLPPSWLTRHNVSVSGISSALHQVRLKQSDTVPMVFEERVGRALAALGPPLP